MLECEGYKMFSGAMEIRCASAPYWINGTWLYKPEYDCWYCSGRSFPASVCRIVAETNVTEDTEKVRIL